LQKVKEQTKTATTPEQLTQQANELNAISIKAVDSLNAILERKQAEREEKVATVIHMAQMVEKLNV
jgi:hypothetical protein